MSYLVLARKWRPQNFDDIIGQEHITQTLKNAVSSGKTAHAFIFSGPRGVGKTSTARVISKALNCDKGPESGPCSECPSCRDITEGRSLDVMEIDAASHTGVNDVREIIENIKYLPTSGKNKIYIIDEAHMLSQSAFNALLKTLEEPPPHVLFILATTEVHKIPVTILSRCQRYDFRRVSVERIKDALVEITTKENIKVDDETLYLIAQEADGSMRDALSLTDQLIATFGSDIKQDEALKVLGILDRSLIKSAVRAILDKNARDSISILHEALQKGVSPKRFAEDLLGDIRSVLMLKTCGRDALSDISEQDRDEIDALSSAQSVHSIELIFKILLEEADSIQRSLYPQMAIELALIKLSNVDDIVPVENILERIERLSKSMGNDRYEPKRFDETRESYPTPSAPPVRSKPKPEERVQDKKEPVTEDIKETPSTPSPVKENKGVKKEHETEKVVADGNNKEDFIVFLKTKKPILATRLERVTDIIIEDSTFRIICAGGSPELEYLKKIDSQKALSMYLNEFYTEELGIQIEESESAENNRKGLRQEKEEKRERIQNNQAVKDAVKVFGGRIISTKPK